MPLRLGVIRLKQETTVHELTEAIKSCQDCALRSTCRGPVPGEGNGLSRVFFIGEAPGEQEDMANRPFCGPSGRLLNQILGAVGLDRPSVYITNVVKCRPPNNRSPFPQEIEVCSRWLRVELDWLSPLLVVTLGRFAASWVEGLYNGQGAFLKISSIVNQTTEVKTKQHHFFWLPLYHPSYMLRKGGKPVPETVQALKQAVNALREAMQ